MPRRPVHPLLAQHARALWGAVRRLCHAGFAIDPYEARVLMVDFGHAAGAASRPLSDDECGHLFYEFAARRWAAQHAAGWCLRDLHAAWQPGPAPAGAWGVDAAERQALADTLLRLPAGEQQRLQAFLVAGLACEWTLATADGSDLAGARRTLHRALAQWLAAWRDAAPGDLPAAHIAVQLWCDGRHAATVGWRLGLPAQEVLAWRQAVGAELATCLQFAGHRPALMHPTKDRSMDPHVFSQCLGLLADGDAEQARRLMADHRNDLRNLLDSRDLLLDPAALRAVHDRPELLAQTYALLFDDDDFADGEPPRAADVRAQRFSADASAGIGDAFLALVESLPDDLVQWSRQLAPPQQGVDGRQILALADLPSVRRGGPAARHLLHQHGLVPETIAGIARSVQLRLDEALAGNAVPAFFADDDAPDAAAPDRDTPVDLEARDLVACVRVAPYVPPDDRLVLSLVQWTLDVLAERPRFVPGYQTVLTGARREQRLRAMPAPGLLPEDLHDLRGLWTWRPPQDTPRAGRR